MRLRFWGTRGSSPVSGADFVEFGGNTPCLEVSANSTEEIVILDSGTGARDLGTDIMKRGDKASPVIHLFLTHAHWDHIQGFPFFVPAYMPRFALNIYCTKDAREFLDGQMKPPYFPVGLDIMRADLRFHRLATRDSVKIGRAVISNVPLPHPQESTAFRVEEDGRSFVLATDTEHNPARLNETLVGHARGTDALIYDAQYTPEEYSGGKEGWGHSTFAEGIKVARAAGAKRLILFSHDPSHGDDDVRKIERAAAELLPGTLAARQGQVLEF